MITKPATPQTRTTGLSTNANVLEKKQFITTQKAAPRIEKIALPTESLFRYISCIANEFSIARKTACSTDELYLHLYALVKEQPSSQAEMDGDWANAWAFGCLRMLEGLDLPFSQLEPAAYPHLEAVWLNNIKELKAFFIWQTEGGSDPVANYFKAASTIRQLILDRKPVASELFENVKKYIEEQYLRDGNTALLDESKAETQCLIARKAHQIYKMTGDPNGKGVFFCARLYVAMFYENIIGAVLDNDPKKIRMVLKALEFSKAPENRYHIINAFEAAIVAYFLDKTALRAQLASPEAYDFNMESVDDWPSTVQMPPEMRYDIDNQKIIYEGLMSENCKRRLQAQLGQEKHLLAIERLYIQSHLQPYEDQIL